MTNQIKGNWLEIAMGFNQCQLKKSPKLTLNLKAKRTD